jgi:arylsulfatase A-like enzyme
MSQKGIAAPAGHAIISGSGEIVKRASGCLKHLVITAATLASGLIPAGAAAQDDRPYVVLVTIDTLRTDRLSCYGYERPTSPNLDRLLDGGLKFTRARTVEPLTNPALCSMITGVSPHVHAASRNGLRMREDLDSLPKILAREGWRTAAFVGNWTLKDNVSRLGEHFDHYGEVFTRRRWFGLINREATAEDVTDEAIGWADDWLAHHPEQPFVLWVHYVEPHAPYRFHAEFADRLGITGSDPSRSDRYDTEVAAVDHEVGRLMTWLGGEIPAERLLIFFAADHGESLGEHSYWGHGRYLYEPSLAIPMGFAWQGRITPRSEDAPALIMDLAPTVLELLDMEVPDDFEGFSWARVIRGADPPMDRAICYQAHKGAVHGTHESELARSKGLISVGLVRDERKEILRVKNNSHLLFDLVDDPEELANLVTEDSSPSPELLRCVGSISDALGSLDRLTTKKLDDETVEQLRALGYLE